MKPYIQLFIWPQNRHFSFGCTLACSGRAHVVPISALVGSQGLAPLGMRTAKDALPRNGDLFFGSS